MKSEMSGTVDSMKHTAEAEENDYVHFNVQCGWCGHFGAKCFRSGQSHGMTMKCVACGYIFEFDGE